MARQPHRFGALHEDHKRALDALNTHINQGKQTERTADIDAGRAGPSVAAGSGGGGREPPDVIVADRDGPERGRDGRGHEPQREEPQRPTQHPGRSVGWTDMGGMVEQQASANKMVQAHWEQKMALFAHMEQQRGGGDREVSSGAPERSAEGRDGRQTGIERNPEQEPLRDSSREPERGGPGTTDDTGHDAHSRNDRGRGPEIDL